jgi:phosphatidylethanolamine/phosphatidyl-N-methylethanolamine N-methyltransferase
VPSGPAGGGSAVARAARRNVRFIREFLANPGGVGAVAPSSRRLAELMVEGVDFEHARVVVEYGPGTGSFTGEIVKRLAPGAKYFAVEIAPRMAREWRRRYPGLPIHRDSVADMRRICREEGLPARGAVDVIFSGLPWAAFKEPLQRELLEATAEVLRPGGLLVTFGYRVGRLMPAGRRFQKLLPEYFSKVTRSRHIWRNLPPAFVIRCEK